MKTHKPFWINSISEVHRLLGLPKPMHPLVSLVDYSHEHANPDQLKKRLVLNFYKVSFRENLRGKIRYGQSHYDFDEGGLFFISPNQIIEPSKDQVDGDGFSLYFHPDFIRKHPLGKKMNAFGFFSYSVHEALHLSQHEKQIVVGIFENIGRELKSSIDDLSQDILLAQIELLLSYSNRFYKRQFITRKDINSELLEKLEKLLNTYWNDESALMQGLPTVQYLAEQVNVTPRYLSDMLRSLTGQNTQQYIHQKLIEKAKEILSVSNLTVADVAYQLGFEHPQSFSKLFKRKTSMSPLEFRQSFN